MDKNKTINDFILKLFIGEEFNKRLNAPFQEDAYVYATNGYSLIQILAANCEKDYTLNDNHPKNVAPMLEIGSQFEMISFSKFDLLEMFSDVEYKFRKSFQTCEKCKGSGDILCLHCEQASECNSCNGTGESKKEELFSKMQLCGEDIHFLGRKFYATRLYPIIQCAYFKEVNNVYVKYTNTENNRNVVFAIDDIKILLIPKNE